MLQTDLGLQEVLQEQRRTLTSQILSEAIHTAESAIKVKAGPHHKGKPHLCGKSRRRRMSQTPLESSTAFETWLAGAKPRKSQPALHCTIRL